MKDTVHYDGPMSPLGVTAYLPRLERGGTRMLADFGFLMEAMRQRAIGWEIYAQAIPPTSDEVVVERIATAKEVVGSGKPDELAHRWWHGGWREEFADRIAALRRRDLIALDDAALDDHLQACLDLLEDGQVAHFQEDDQDTPADAWALYELGLVLRTGGGRLHTGAAVRGWLADAGLAALATDAAAPRAQALRVHLVVGRRPG